MPALLTFLLPALAPALTDAVRVLMAKISGTSAADPKTPADKIALMQAETARLEALAKLDAPIGEPAQWVVNVRATFRYAAVTVIWIIAACALFIIPTHPLTAVLLDMCGATLSFIIGERFYLKVKG